MARKSHTCVRKKEKIRVKPNVVLLLSNKIDTVSIIIVFVNSSKHFDCERRHERSFRHFIDSWPVQVEVDSKVLVEPSVRSAFHFQRLDRDETRRYSWRFEQLRVGEQSQDLFGLFEPDPTLLARSEQLICVMQFMVKNSSANIQ